MRVSAKDGGGGGLRGLPPLDTPGARYLVLGSFPSALSLEKSEYYGHPRNQFWSILATIAETPTPPDWPSKVELAARLGVAIWDLVATCDREGSLDADIRGAILNDVEGFVASRASLGLVLLNGGAAAAFFARRFAPGSGLDSSNFGDARAIVLGGKGLLACRLPSTSPVPTRRFRTAADKLPFWRGAFLSLSPLPRLDKSG